MTYGEAVLVPNYEYESGIEVEISEANARLIAAAPDTAAERDRLKEKLAYFSCLHGKERDRLAARVAELEGLLQWFCDRCDKGEVRSKRTYKAFKEALSPQPGSQKDRGCPLCGSDAVGCNPQEGADFECGTVITFGSSCSAPKDTQPGGQSDG
jgi:hypothetical protein